MKMSEPMKRILALSLSLLLVLTLLPAGALAVDTYTTSVEGVRMIEEFEGFSSTAYADNGKWYIGYGTLCEPSDYPNGISELEADQLMRDALVVAEDVVNNLLMDYSISVTQYQFDAMVSMTYNLGTQWIVPEYRFCGYLISGIWQYTETEVVNAIATWCHQGSMVRESLVNRRLREAYLFLYGQYDNAGPDNYTYIHYSPNGGTVENRTVFYPVGQPYGTLATPVQKGRTFLGWYLDDGTQITGLETAMEDITVTARWDGEGTGSANEVDETKWVNPYRDVSSTDWYYTYVRELSVKAIVGGYADGTFQAAKELSAGEALKLILVAAGYQDPGNSASGHWAENYLALAESLGCVYAGEIANLDGSISRLTIARIAAVAMGLLPREGASPFADVNDGYTLALYEEGILNGSVVSGQRYYHPEDGINRAEMCAIVSRINGWEYEEVNDPSKSGFIKFRKQYLPVLWDVPVAPYNKNLFVLDGSRMYYNDPNYTTEIGIDVSRHQEEIDWTKVAASGIDFVMIRLGYRGWGSEGKVNLDARFEENLRGAKAAGLKVGVYFYSQAITTEEAREEAQFVLDHLGGVALEYPVAYDWEIVNESGARTKGLGVDALTDCTIAFCDTIAQAGYKTIIYSGFDVSYLRMDLSRLTGYDFWFPQYSQKPTMYYNYRIWQYSDKGTVPGISTKVDMDIAFVPYN